MADYVGHHGPYREQVLYCSRKCAQKAGAKEIRPLRPEEYETEKFGALCKICEAEYENF